MAWAQSPKIHGLLLDITGVLYNSGEGGGAAIAGSVDAVSSLRTADIPVRFCTNETQVTCRKLVEKLRRLGFDDIEENEVFSPVPAVVTELKRRRLRPHLLVHSAALPDFDGLDTSDPNAVVVGDAAEYFTYDRLNEAFLVLMKSPDVVLFSLGMGRYYCETDGLKMDNGAFTRALEYASGKTAEIIGKPAKSYFLSAVNRLGVSAESVVMIGDDVVSDVGGAQQAGLRGVLVRSGKYRPTDEHHPDVKPSGIVDDLAQAVDIILRGQ
ncbi:phospholysine phosphohistidine inorganic pyrophosphate phosphatase-like [Corticium candelabrum]|uniref:phospholysine phosphohistidine inorganic pyrophosphate phosphatase-like n=1 Tax=Corticium candelabrum TaxID=121492 RepID=UPI002E25C392|nr:phospholysine phosphohistidine inorganic pyrophosphate phosphatase-like [Corticium candelabrum]